MRILFNLSELGKGGAERVVSVLANGMAKEHTVGILANNFERVSYITDPSVALIPLDKKAGGPSKLRNVRRLFATPGAVRSFAPDVVISFLHRPSYRLLAVKPFLRGVPVIVSDRNDPEKEYAGCVNNLLMRLLYRRADGFVFQTRRQKEYFTEKIRERSAVICNPVAPKFAVPAPDAVRDGKMLISYGRLTPQKNHRLLIDAFAEAAKTRPELTLKIFGEGPLLGELEARAEELGLAGRVSFPGVSDHIETELARAGIFVLSSDYEGMPNALIEAMVAGLPAIATDCPCGGPAEIIEDGENGLLVPVGDVSALSGAIGRLADDSELAGRLASNARRLIEKTDENIIISKWEDFAREVIGRRGGKEARSVK